jgi:hypothetical protein
VVENGRLAEVAYPDGLQVLPTYGVTFDNEIGPREAATADILIATVENDLRRLLIEPNGASHLQPGLV